MLMLPFEDKDIHFLAGFDVDELCLRTQCLLAFERNLHQVQFFDDSTVLCSPSVLPNV